MVPSCWRATTAFAFICSVVVLIWSEKGKPSESTSRGLLVALIVLMIVYRFAKDSIQLGPKPGTKAVVAVAEGTLLNPADPSPGAALDDQPDELGSTTEPQS